MADWIPDKQFVPDNKDWIPDAVMAAPAVRPGKPGYLSKAWTEATTPIENADGMTGTIVKGVRKAGNVAGDLFMAGAKGALNVAEGAYDVLTYPMNPATKKTIEDIAKVKEIPSLLKTDIGKAQLATLGDAGRAYGAVKQAAPNVMEGAEAGVSALNILPVAGGAKLVAPVAKEAALIGADAARLAGRGIVKKALPGAEGILESGAKWSTTLSPEARKRVSQTMLREKIVLNPKGYEKLENTVDDLNSQIKTALAPHNEKPIDAEAVLRRTSEAKSKANKSYDRKGQLAKVEEEVSAFRDNWGDNLTVADAQAIKQDIYKQLKSHYDSVAKGGPGKYTDGEIAAKKNIAKGLKEEIEAAAGDANIKALNARESDLLNLEPHLRRAVGRVGNHNILSLDDVLAAGVGSAVGGPVGVVAAGVAKRALGAPAMKSRIAIGLNSIERGVQQPARLVSRTGQALTAEQPTLAAYLSPGADRVPLTGGLAQSLVSPSMSRPELEKMAEALAVTKRDGAYAVPLQAPPTRPVSAQTNPWDFALKGQPVGPPPPTRAELVAARNAGTIEAERAAQPRMYQGTQPPVGVEDLNPGLQADIDKFLRRQAQGTELATVPPQAPRGDFADLLMQLKMRQPENISLQAQKGEGIIPATLGRSAESGRLLPETPAEAARFAAEQGLDPAAINDARKYLGKRIPVKAGSGRKTDPPQGKATLTKKKNAAQEYLGEEINYGGEIRTRGSVIAEMQADGIPQPVIDAYLMGQARQTEISRATPSRKNMTPTATLINPKGRR
jgi:hypothetical protein